MKYYRGGFEITIKADQTPVTQADQEAEKAIRAILARATPGFGFLGEEFGQEGSTSHRWIIDPIDGTKNFVRHIPIWAVLIALEEEGQVTTGVVHNPVTGELFWARKGEGAWANGERIHVSPCAAMGDAMLLHSSLNLLKRIGLLGRIRAPRGRDRRVSAASATTTATAWWRRARARSTPRPISSPGMPRR